MNRLHRWQHHLLLQVAIIFLFTPIVQGRSVATMEPPEQVVERLQQRYQEITSLSFSFSQKTSGQLAGRPKTGSGSGFLFKGEQQTLMRWNYHSPDYQVVISDGVSVSMYFENLNQMIVAPADTTQTDVLVSFFTGDRALNETFLILPPEPDQALADEDRPDELSGVQLVPRHPQAQLRSVHLYIGTDSLIRRIEMMDHFDTSTIIDLEINEVNPFDIRDNAAIDRTFSFTPPPGTEIIRQ